MTTQKDIRRIEKIIGRVITRVEKASRNGAELEQSDLLQLEKATKLAILLDKHASDQVRNESATDSKLRALTDFLNNAPPELIEQLTKEPQ